MGARRTTRYTRMPRVPPALRGRTQVILEVLSGVMTVSQGARELGLSRNHFQTLLHRALRGLIEAITPQRGGRPRASPLHQQLKAQLAQSERERTKLQTRVRATDRLLEIASHLLHARTRPMPRAPRARAVRERHGESAQDPDPDPRARVVREVEVMCALGMTRTQAAVLAGRDPATLRRWRAAQRPVRRAVPAPDPDAGHAARVARAQQRVRALHGLIGAEALRRAVPGLSRREAGDIKARTLTQMERERRAQFSRVSVRTPGVLRGMDAIQLGDRGDRHYALLSADAAVPYRTSFVHGPHYDGELVLRALVHDFEVNGAPLVLRMDRYRAHEVEPVRQWLAQHQVLVLHGPPHCARFYGQLERQNREHRAWLAGLPWVPWDALDARLEQMRHTLNALWPRRALRWQTPLELWEQRPTLRVNRTTLRQEVMQQTARIARRLAGRRHHDQLAERLAIIQVLERRGYLRLTRGDGC